MIWTLGNLKGQFTQIKTLDIPTMVKKKEKGKGLGSAFDCEAVFMLSEIHSFLVTFPSSLQQHEEWLGAVRKGLLRSSNKGYKARKRIKKCYGNLNEAFRLYNCFLKSSISTFVFIHIQGNVNMLMYL